MFFDLLVIYFYFKIRLWQRKTSQQEQLITLEKRSILLLNWLIQPRKVFLSISFNSFIIFLNSFFLLPIKEVNTSFIVFLFYFSGEILMDSATYSKVLTSVPRMEPFYAEAVGPKTMAGGGLFTVVAVIFYFWLR